MPRFWIEIMLAGSEIKSMSATERLQAKELLLRSFSGLEDEVPSPDWHGEVLSARLAKVEADEGNFSVSPNSKTDYLPSVGGADLAFLTERIADS